MNNDSLAEYIKNTRDCDASMLDAAVLKGFNRSVNAGKNFSFIKLAAACAVTAALCIAINSEAFRITAGNFTRDAAPMTQSDSETLYIYLTDTADFLINYLRS
ncbi:MAG: hypothetical protein FWG32_05700 [Oscillospiraceae bacterium]|nr:hypothetical protein [Oscillospiraceae bacterium]